MILVDTALQKRLDQNRPIKIGLVGAGYSARNIAYQIIRFFPAIRIVAIANRSIQHAMDVYKMCGIDDVVTARSMPQINQAIIQNKFVVTEDYSHICENTDIECVVEATGIVDFGAHVAFKAIKNGKHIVVMNCEMDATVGPILKYYADKNDVIYTNTDGDEPGVASNMYRFVKTIGLKPILAGNLKGFYDPYRNPDTQLDFALKNNQKPRMMTSFIDGTKLSFELTVLANCLGFGVGKRGMFGPKCADVREAAQQYQLDKYHEQGIVDYLLGAAPGTGAYVIGYSEDKVKKEYLRYLKMGDGPYYVFYTPFHLPHQEIPITIARAVLFRDATVTPKGKPYCEVITVAKKNLKKGEVLDGIGGYTCYSLIDNAELCTNDNFLPMGVAEGCTLKKDIVKDQPITYNDVHLPEGRVCDELRQEQTNMFFKK